MLQDWTDLTAGSVREMQAVQHLLLLTTMSCRDAAHHAYVQ